MNYVEQDSFGMYAVSDSNGPGPRLMGASVMPYCRSADCLAWAKSYLPCLGKR
jgi:hypothetical protein